MGKYTVYCSESWNLKNLSGGVGELRIDTPSVSRGDSGALYFNASPIPAGEVFERASALSVYCHAPYPVSLVFGNIAGPSWNGSEWKQTTDGIEFKDGRLKCPIGITTQSDPGSARFWVNGSDHVPYAEIQTHSGSIRSRDYSPANTTIRKGFYHRFSWQTTAEIPINGPLQVSYTEFQWRAKGASDWRTVRVSGDQNYVDFDTGLVPNSASPGMEWQAVVHASNGVSATGGYTSVSFQSTTVRLADMIPSSKAATYKGFSVNFSWELSYTKPDNLSGSIRQVSAKLRWRKNGTQNYTEYAINSATQAYTIPAGVLPIGNIDWQVEVTDTSGGTTASNWITFNHKELAIGIDELYPSDGSHILKHVVNRFKWAITADETESLPGSIIQTSAVLRYRTQGKSDVKSISIQGSKNYYDFPANTFKANDIEWQVEVTANTGTTGVSQWLHVNTQDALSIPVCVSPVGTIVEDTEGITFVWRHEVSTGTKQKAYELQTSTNMGGNYTTLSTAETEVSSFSTPTGKFSQGTLMWRVRTKNSDGIWGSYSAVATIIIRRSPAKPIIIFTDTKPRPTIRWESQDQQGVRIQIGSYDTGWMHSTVKEYRMPHILADGKYSVRLTVKTIFGVESPPAISSLTVQNVPGPPITASFSTFDNCTSLQWKKDNAYIAYYILRAGVPIAHTENNIYTDRMSNGKQAYMIRGMTADGYYGDSAPVYTYLAIENAVLGLTEDSAPWIPLRLRRGERPTHKGNYSVQIDYVYYYGRKKPVAYTNHMLEASHDFSFTLRDPVQVQMLRSLLGENVVYKDCWGDVLIGILGSVQMAQGRATDVEFTITETDFRQEVAYVEG